jgi:hypothetical protein
MLLYANSKLTEIEIKKAVQFIIDIKIKYLAVNLTKERKDPYNENYKTLMNETDEDSKNGKHPSFEDWKNIIKLSIMPKIIYKINAILIKISMTRN